MPAPTHHSLQHFPLQKLQNTTKYCVVLNCGRPHTYQAFSRILSLSHSSLPPNTTHLWTTTQTHVWCLYSVVLCMVWTNRKTKRCKNRDEWNSGCENELSMVSFCRTNLSWATTGSCRTHVIHCTSLIHATFVHENWGKSHCVYHNKKPVESNLVTFYFMDFSKQFPNSRKEQCKLVQIMREIWIFLKGVLNSKQVNIHSLFI